jgi:hypothetical protein
MLTNEALRKVKLRAEKAQKMFASLYSFEGDLPPLKVYAKWPSKYRHHAGIYDGSIHLDANNQLIEFTLFHEMSHFIDGNVLLLPYRVKNRRILSYASTSTDINIYLALSGWRRAVNRSITIATLKLWLKNDKNKDIEHTRYLLKEEEIFARSLAQYSAMLSGRPEILGQLGCVQPRSTIDIYTNGQWARKDFEPIALKIEQLLKSEKMLK